MDFVVIGLGLSALALLTGLILLCLIAPRWSRKSGAAPEPAQSTYARALAGERSALGQAFLGSGAILLLVTIGGISAGLSDKMGAYLVATITTIAVLAMFGWDLLYRRRNPIPLQPREATPPAKPVDPAERLAPASLGATPPAATTTVRRRVLPARQRSVPMTEALATAPTATAVGDNSMIAADEEPAAAAAAEAAIGIVELETPAPGDAAVANRSQPPARDTEEAPSPSAQAAETAPQGADAPALRPPETPTPESSTVAPPGIDPLSELTAMHDTGPEAEFLPNGNDKVIALFPTAAALRKRATIAPTVPDGES